MRDKRKILTAVAAALVAICLLVTGIVISGYREGDAKAADQIKKSAKMAVKVKAEATGTEEATTPSIETPVEVQPATLEFTAKKKAIKAGKSYTFKVNLEGAVWKSSKTAVATVSSNGKVSAKKVGKTKITATVGTQSVSITIKVKPKKIIGIDAGHQRRANLSMEPVGPGSSQTKIKVSGGTSGRTTGVPEYVLTLDIAKKLKAILEDRGYQVVMTRTKHDVDISNKERALKLNEKCNIAVRLHADGADSSSAKGASMLYPGTDNPYVANLSAKSKKLSQKILDSYLASTGLSKRGQGLYVRNDLTGTNWSTIPVALIEMGFMTNASDDTYMQTKAGQKAMAEGLANGIDAYFGY
jgi:N-acetylmuramoyl-L-alanine amidase